ncbi:MAG: hypothetical protein ACXIUW_01410 [Roseinatronobacter sp.]
MTRLSRIDGGVALQTRGVSLVLFDDRLRLIQWSRSRAEFRTVVDQVTRILGSAFPIEDAREVSAARSDRPADQPQDSAADRIVPEPEETEYQQDIADETGTPTPPDDDDFAPGF